MVQGTNERSGCLQPPHLQGSSQVSRTATEVTLIHFLERNIGLTFIFCLPSIEIPVGTFSQQIFNIKHAVVQSVNELYSLLTLCLVLHYKIPIGM